MQLTLTSLFLAILDLIDESIINEYSDNYNLYWSDLYYSNLRNMIDCFLE